MRSKSGQITSLDFRIESERKLAQRKTAEYEKSEKAGSAKALSGTEAALFIYLHLFLYFKFSLLKYLNRIIIFLTNYNITSAEFIDRFH